MKHDWKWFWIALVYVLTVIFGVALAGCQTPGDDYAASRLATVTAYAARPDRRTPGGLAYGGDLDPARLDAITAAVEGCLAAMPEPDAAQRAAAACVLQPIRRDVDRAAFSVLVAPDWHPSCDGAEQVFACAISDAGCLAKGLVPTAACPCSCRAVAESGPPSRVVVTPNLRLYAGELTRLVTGCNNAWLPPLSACAGLGTDPTAPVSYQP